MTKNLAKSKSLALLGVDDEAEYFPEVLPTAEGAHRLTVAVLTLAFHALEEERETGSELPDMYATDPETGVVSVSLAYEAMLHKRSLVYLQTMGQESEASTFEILAEINERQLYFWDAEPWQSLAEFVRSLGEGRSVTYASVWERIATKVLPFLQVEKIVGVREIMDIIVQGGKSNLNHLLSNMLSLLEDEDIDQQTRTDRMAEIFRDAKGLTRSEIDRKYKSEARRVPPARATLTFVNPHWELVVKMTEAQKGIVLNRLGPRVEYE